MGVPYGEMIVSVFASTASPGPNNILLLSSSSRHGLKKCLPLEAGIMTGLLTVMLLVGLACGLLGPQVAFEIRQFEPKFKEAGVPFAVIPLQDYGMIRGDRVMQMALDMIEEAKKQ